MHSGGDHLEQLPIYHGKSRPQRLMASEDLLKTPLQGLHVERTLQAYSVWDVKQRQAREHLIEEPELFLCDSSLQWALSWHAHNRLPLPPLLTMVYCFDDGCKFGDGGRFKEAGERYSNVGGVVHARQQLHGEE